MRKMRRILALLMALALLLTATAISEEQIAPAEAEQSAPVEALVEEEPAAEAAPEEIAEEPAEEAAAEPAEEIAEEPVEEPAEEPAEELAEEPTEEPAEEPEAELPEEAEIEDINASNKCPVDPDGEHDFWDNETDEPSDTCSLCGYKCTHPAKSRFKESEMLNWSVFKLDAQYHVVVGDLQEVTYCGECYMPVSDAVVKSIVRSKEEHDFSDDNGDETDVCYWCGYDRSGCPHTNRLYYIDISEDYSFEDIQIDKNYHTVSGYMCLSEYCADCGKTFKDSEYGHYTDIREAHWFEKGKCIMCGYKGSCKHPNLHYYPGEGGVPPYYVNYGNPTYHYNHMEDVVAYCETCDFNKEYKTLDVKEEHVFLPENPNVCVLCGYKAQPTGVTIDPPAKTALNIGDTLPLTAKVTPAGIEADLLWSSSNRAVATVDEKGVVTAVGAGSAKITVQSTNKKKSKAVAIQVVDPSIPTKLSFSSKQIDKKLDDENVQLKTLLTVEPATAKLMWISSDYGIVYVDEETGEAEMTGTGTATITVTAVAAGGKKAKKASIKIAVTDSSAPEKITLEPSGKITMNTGDQPVTIKATLSPQAASKWAVDWNSSNRDVATVTQDGVVTAVSKGTAKITATAAMNNNKGKPVLASVTVQVKGDSFIPESMSLSAETLNLTTDSDPAEITAALTPADAQYGSFTWTNSDKSVVNLIADGDSATVEAVGGGTAKITVTAQKNKKLKKIVTVNVTDPHAPTSFKLAADGNMKLFLGEDMQLMPTFEPAGATSDVTYKANKKGIVDLDAETGWIMPLQEGTVEITGTTLKKIGDGKKAKPATAKLKVQVVDPTRPAKIALDKSVTNLKVGDKIKLSYALTAEKADAAAVSSVGWKISNAKVAMIDDAGNLYALAAGKVKVTVTTDAKGADGKAKSDTIEITIT